jgi:ubiquitin-conjugating enzyme E2 N
MNLKLIGLNKNLIYMVLDNVYYLAPIKSIKNSIFQKIFIEYKYNKKQKMLQSIISKRTFWEIRKLRQDREMLNTKGIDITENEENYRHFKGYIIGPKDTPYEGGKFNFEVYLPEEYPIEPMIIIITTKIFHPNVTINGKVIIDVLNDKWNASMSIKPMIIHLLELLEKPNFNDCWNNIVEGVLKNTKGRENYNTIARDWTLKYAINNNNNNNNSIFKNNER